MINMERSASDIAFASSVLAGQVSLAGLGLVLLGILLSRHGTLSPTGDPGDAPLVAEFQYRRTIFQNARAIVLLFLGTGVPVAWLIEGFSIWWVVAAYVYSAVIVLYILLLNVWIFVFQPGEDGQGSITSFIRTMFWFPR